LLWSLFTATILLVIEAQQTPGIYAQAAPIDTRTPQQSQIGQPSNEVVLYLDVGKDDSGDPTRRVFYSVKDGAIVAWGEHTCYFQGRYLTFLGYIPFISIAEAERMTTKEFTEENARRFITSNFQSGKIVKEIDASFDVKIEKTMSDFGPFPGKIRVQASTNFLTISYDYHSPPRRIEVNVVLDSQLNVVTKWQTNNAYPVNIGQPTNEIILRRDLYWTNKASGFVVSTQEWYSSKEKAIVAVYSDDGHGGNAAQALRVKPDAFYVDGRYLTILTAAYEFLITEAERMQTNVFSEEAALSFAKTNFPSGKVVKRFAVLPFFERPANWNPYTEHTIFPIARGVKLDSNNLIFTIARERDEKSPITNVVLDSHLNIVTNK